MALRNRAPVTEVQEEVVETETETETKLPFEANAQEAAAEEQAEVRRVREAKAEVAEALTDGIIPEEAKLAPVQESTGVSTQIRTPSTEELFNQAGKALEEAGFGGLDDGFGAYAIIALKNEGQFEDTDGESFGHSFEGIILDSKPKYVVGNTKCEKRDEVAIYTYDGVTDANSGAELKPTLEGWAEKGWGFDKRPYTEVTVDLVGGDREGEVVLLSLPKTSRTKYTGYIKTNARRYRVVPSGYVTEFRVGDKISNAAGDFYPWKFRYVRPVNNLEA